MRIFSRVEYDGTHFCGWQIQRRDSGAANAPTVQEELQKAISRIVGQDVEVVGAGRTDAGVHARNQGFHFDTDAEIRDFEKLAYQINSVLPQSIAVFDMREAASDFHARFSAVERTYHYYITQKKSPLSFNYALHFGYKLDLQKMQSELDSIAGQRHSFESFCSSGNQLDNFFCEIKSAEIVKTSQTSFYVRISANRFLYNMVRAIVGTLVDISRGKINMSLLEIIAKNDRKFAGTTAPAKGLVLEDVRY